MKKRAMTAETAVPLIILLVAILILIPAVIFMSKQISSKEARLACQASVEVQAMTRIGAIDSPFDIKCHTFGVEFFKDHVEIDGEKVPVSVEGKEVKQFEQLTDDIVNQVLANELAWCWSQFHAGQMNIFNVEFMDFRNWKKICFICDEVRFNSNVQAAKFSGFYEYLNTRENINFGGTYYKYIAESPRLCDNDYEGNGNCWEGYLDAKLTGKADPHKPMVRDIQFHKGTTYSIFFVREGIRANRDNPTYFSYIIPTSELRAQCDKHVPAVD